MSRRYGLTEERLAHWLLLVDTMGVAAPVRRRLPVHVRDPKDDHLLASALGGQADSLVTGDFDILSLKADSRLQWLRIVSAVEFLDALAASGE